VHRHPLPNKGFDFNDVVAGHWCTQLSWAAVTF
jgi:hypothetical protein